MKKIVAVLTCLVIFSLTLSAQEASSSDAIYKAVYSTIEHDGFARAIAVFADKNLPNGTLESAKVRKNQKTHSGYWVVEMVICRGGGTLCVVVDTPHCENCPPKAGKCS
jgi:hypothetical protein